MTEKREPNPYEPSLMDTQRLLQGVELPGDDEISLESILAEYRSHPAVTEETPSEKKMPQAENTPEAEKAPEAEQPPEEVVSPGAESSQPEESGEETAAEQLPTGKPLRKKLSKILRFPIQPQMEGEEEMPHLEEPEAPEIPDLQPDADLDGIQPDKMFGLTPEENQESLPENQPEMPDDTLSADNTASDQEDQSEASSPTLTMEDVVASTVDAVKEEQERRQEKFRKRLEKERRKHAPRQIKRKEPSFRHPLPDDSQEPALSGAATIHKRRYYECRKGLLLSLPVLIVLWLPWLLSWAGTSIPFFSESIGNSAICVLVPQALICLLCWPVFRAALEGLREKTFTIYATAALGNLVTLLDEMTLLLLPQRSAVSPLGGLSALMAVFTLWGLTDYHRGMWETFRIGAMGTPGHVVDRCEEGIAKGRGSIQGFYTRANVEDTAAQWQRLLLPVLAAASLVFSVLASVGQGRGQDLLWVWSVILCASSALVCPLVYFVPFGRLAVRLARSGAAVAGQYGAVMLASVNRIVVTDGDLFPQGTVALNGLKLYGEERNHALSYAATLAVQAGGCLGRIFGDICRGERIALQPLEHFHIHDDNGLSGMIHGETVLVGTPAFMRHKAVRLPATMPSRTTVCLAVDGELTAVFAVKYNTSELVEVALRALSRNGLHLALAVRDGNITPKLLKTRFGTDGGAAYLELSERLAMSDPDREAGGPNGILYREGLFPFVDMVAGSRRLCHIVRIGNFLSMLSSTFGVLVGFYLTFTGSYSVLTPVLLLTYLLLWVVPMLPLLWGVDKS